MFIVETVTNRRVFTFNDVTRAYFGTSLLCTKKGVYSKALFCSTAVEDPGEENEDIILCELLRPPQDAAQEVCLLSSFIRPFGQLIRH